MTFEEFANTAWGVNTLNIQEEKTYSYWYNLARDISRFSFAGDYEGLYYTIWPYVKRIFKRHYGELVTNRTRDTVIQELELIKTEVMESATINRNMAAVAFRSCVHDAEAHYFRVISR